MNKKINYVIDEPLSLEVEEIRIKKGLKNSSEVIRLAIREMHNKVIQKVA